MVHGIELWKIHTFQCLAVPAAQNQRSLVMPREIRIREVTGSWRRGRLLIRRNARQVTVKGNRSVDGGCVVSLG